jgi:hypothetical protein
LRCKRSAATSMRCTPKRSRPGSARTVWRTLPIAPKSWALASFSFSWWKSWWETSVLIRTKVLIAKLERSFSQIFGLSVPAPGNRTQCIDTVSVALKFVGNYVSNLAVSPADIVDGNVQVEFFGLFFVFWFAAVLVCFCCKSLKFYGFSPLMILVCCSALLLH